MSIEHRPLHDRHELSLINPPNKIADAEMLVLSIFLLPSLVVDCSLFLWTVEESMVAAAKRCILYL
jgi:hypothetical protein